MHVRALGAPGVVGLVVCGLSIACIAEGPRGAGDAGDGGDTRLSDGSDPDSGGEDASGPDAASDSGGNDGSEPEVVEPACDDDFDCGFVETQVCRGWVCQEGACVEVPLSGDSCDDGDLCSEYDFCDGGVCATGVIVDCTSLATDCWFATGDICEPTTGCPGFAVAAGEACNDGFDEEGGACRAGWYLPYDQCDGSGHCLDMSYLVPTGIHPLAGDWHAVISTVTSDGAADTLRADLVFGQFGGLDANNVTATDSSWQRDLGNPSTTGAYCADIAGAFTFVRGGNVYSGLSDPTRSVMVFGSDGAEALGVAIRPTGDSTQVHGAYRVAYTARDIDRDDALSTWQGTLEFDAGCLVAGSLATTPGLGPVYTVVEDLGSPCLEQRGLGRWSLRAEYFDSTGPAVSVRWLGAIGADGDVLLLTREHGESGDSAALEYGTVLFVRDRDAATRDSMRGPWGFFSQRGGVRIAADGTTISRSENGYFELGEGFDSISGLAHNPVSDELLSGGWWFTSAGGQYSQRIAIGEEVLHHSGYIAPNENMVVAWNVQPPDASAGEPQALRLAPREGSLFVALRILPFAEGAVPSR